MTGTDCYFGGGYICAQCRKKFTKKRSSCAKRRRYRYSPNMRRSPPSWREFVAGRLRLICHHVLSIFCVWAPVSGSTQNTMYQQLEDSVTKVMARLSADCRTCWVHLVAISRNSPRQGLFVFAIKITSMPYIIKWWFSIVILYSVYTVYTK